MNNDEEENTHLPHQSQQYLTPSQPRTPPPPPNFFSPQSKLRFINKSFCTVKSAVFIHVTFILRAVHQAQLGRLI